ncbi:MAG: hypothetical protein ACI814_000254 [Mariniblastus sp.]|jgi:hypothetical protein
MNEITDELGSIRLRSPMCIVFRCQGSLLGLKFEKRKWVENLNLIVLKWGH